MTDAAVLKNAYVINGSISSGLPDFSWHIVPKRGKIEQITTKNTK
jgi:hypothetical protein